MAENAAELPSESATKPAARSRVTNGTKFAEGLDGRTKWGRRFKDLCDHYGADLGGLEGLTASQLSLTKRAAALTVEIERHEASFSEKGEADPDVLRDYQSAINSLRRLLETLGLTGAVKAIQRRQPVFPATFPDGVRIEAPLLPGSVATKQYSAEDVDAARRITFIISRALAEGHAIPPALAALAAEIGIATIKQEDRADEA